MKGYYTKKNTEDKKKLKEDRVKNTEEFKEGNEFGLEIFKEVKFVDVKSKTIGKGFAGVMKRHNFGGLRASHGVSVSHRSHGSTGQRQDPGKVFKGKKMAGHMGDKTRTIQNIEIIKSDLDNNLLYLKGSIPGSKNTEAKKKLKEFKVNDTSVYKEGNEFGLEIFKDIKFVDTRSKTIGKGFAGAMKRWNFGGLRASHGVSVSHRAHGSTGHSQDPGKVFKGKKMAGHMGDRLRTMLNIEIIKTDLENELLYLKGSIPGSKNTEVVVRKSIKNINKMTISEKIAAAEEAKKTPDKKKK